MSEHAVAGLCGNEDCLVAAGGACLLGHADPLDCEEYEPEESIEEAGDLTIEPQQESAVEQITSVRGRASVQFGSKDVPFHSGEALTALEARGVLQQVEAYVVISIGAVDVGKTTMLAGIYETVVIGNTHHAFAGSLSLIGFERRRFSSTEASNRTVATVERTSRDTDRCLLHLALVRDGRTYELLLADVSGENAQELHDYGDAGQYGPLLQSATHVLLLVDGKRLAHPDQRHSCVEEARTLSRALAETKLVRSNCDVVIVVTKGDALGIEDSESRASMDEAVSAIRESWPDASSLVVAARDVDATSDPSTTGISTLLDSLIDGPNSRNGTPTTSAGNHYRTDSNFQAGGNLLAKFMYRPQK